MAVLCCFIFALSALLALVSVSLQCEWKEKQLVGCDGAVAALVSLRSFFFSALA